MHTTEPVTEQFGHLTIITWKDTEIISINVFTSGTRNSTLSAAYPHTDREGAKAWYRTIRDAGLAGRPVWQIEAMLSALIDAAQTVDQAEQDMVDGIRANMQAAQPTPVDVSDIVPQGAGSWQALRRNVRRDYTKTRVHTQPPTPAELARIRAARHNNDGTYTVTRAAGQSWQVLKALHARLGGTPTYRRNTRIIDALTFPANVLAGYREELAA